MARNGSGTYSLPAGNPVTTGTAISSSTHNTTMSDIETALTNSVARNGEAPFTADQPMGNNKITGLKLATAGTDAMSLKNFQAQTGVYSATVGGTADVITITPSPAITAYAAGNKFSFIASGANTTNVTVNVNGLGAKAITKRGATALVAGDIVSSSLVTIQYDGTQFQLLSPIGAELGTMAVQDASSVAITGGTITGITDLAIADGGTAASTAADAFTNLKQAASTSATGVVELATEAEVETGTSTTLVPSVDSMRKGLRVHSALASIGTSTVYDVTGLPSWFTKLTVWLKDVSTDGTELVMMQLGDATTAGFITTGYDGSTASIVGTTSCVQNSTTHALESTTSAATHTRHAVIVVELVDVATNTWSIKSSLGLSNTNRMNVGVSLVELAGHCDRFRISSNGTPDNFDGGNVAYAYE